MKCRWPYEIRESKRFPEEYISSLMNREEDEEAGVYNYSAVLEPLGRGVEYVYRIKELGKNALSKIYTLYIQPESDTFSFLFAGDPQLGADALNRDGCWMEENSGQRYPVCPGCRLYHYRR